MEYMSVIGSTLDSFFGPFKSTKALLEENVVHFVRCPLHLLQKMSFKDPVSHLIEETLTAHHEHYGCSTTSLLAMWYFWSLEFKELISNGCEIKDIVEHAQSSLNQVISRVSEITLPCNKICVQKNQDTVRSFHNDRRHGTVRNGKVSMTPKGVFASIKFTSRHFSPSSSEDVDKDDEAITEFCPLNSQTQRDMLGFVQKLSRESDVLTNLVHDVWTRQVTQDKSTKFNIDCLYVCPVSLPQCFSTVVDGLVIKTNSCSFSHKLCERKESRALIINGSVTFESVHLGHSEKVKEVVQETCENIKVCAKNKWFEECCHLLSKLQVNVVLTNGEVDECVSSFCSSHSILLVTQVPFHLLQVICSSAGIHPVYYLLDCDENVIVNCTVKNLFQDKEDMLGPQQLFHINLINKKLATTVVLCHPNESTLRCEEHHFWHLASRLHLSTHGGATLPGGGRTEKWCAHLLDTGNESVEGAVARGFFRYFETVSSQASDDCLDDLESKTQAWRSAMALCMAILQLDAFIQTGCDDTDDIQNVIGYL